MRQPRLLKAQKEWLTERLIELRDQGITQAEASLIVGRTNSSIASFCCNNNIHGWPIGAAARDQTGPNNVNYIDGNCKSTIRRTAKRIVKADGRKTNVCERCGNINKWQDHTIHHKNRDRTHNVPENLEVLCNSCHNKEHMPEQERNELGQFI